MDASTLNKFGVACLRISVQRGRTTREGWPGKAAGVAQTAPALVCGGSDAGGQMATNSSILSINAFNVRLMVE